MVSLANSPARKAVLLLLCGCTSAQVLHDSITTNAAADALLAAAAQPAAAEPSATVAAAVAAGMSSIILALLLHTSQAVTAAPASAWPWPYDWSRFPAAWFGSNATHWESPGQIAAIGKYSMAILGWQHLGLTDNMTAVVYPQLTQMAIIKDAHPSLPVLVYCSLGWAFGMNAAVWPLMSDSSYKDFFLQSSGGSLEFSRTNCQQVGGHNWLCTCFAMHPPCTHHAPTKHPPCTRHTHPVRHASRSTRATSTASVGSGTLLTPRPATTSCRTSWRRWLRRLLSMASSSTRSTTATTYPRS